MKFYSCCLIIISVLFAGCQKSDTTPDPINPGPIIPPPVVTNVNGVYVGGMDNNFQAGARVWRDGVVSSFVISPFVSEVRSVYVYGSDVYAVGMELSFAVLWKNGTRNQIASNAAAHSIFVSGSDVYIAGAQSVIPGGGNKPAIWKNGVQTLLSAGSYTFGTAYSVTVDGSDVYVAGSVIDNNIIYPILWKNGVATFLPTINSYGNAYSVFVSGADVYVAGNVYQIPIQMGSVTATIWKNGIRTTYSNVPMSTALGIIVSGTDVYAVGSTQDSNGSRATIWKNGVVTYLINSTVANAIFVSGSDVYIAGMQSENSVTKARLWKNGVEVPLTLGTGNSVAYSVFVKQ